MRTASPSRGSARWPSTVSSCSSRRRKRISLRITDGDASQSVDKLLFANTDYRLFAAPGEVTWTATTKLTVFGRTLDQLTFTVPASLDVAAVERHFGSAVTSRMIGNTCELSAIKPGIVDELEITNEVVDPAHDTFSLKRGDCASGTNRDPGVRCLQGLGDVAFFVYGKLNIYRGNRHITIALGTYPENPAVNDADSIALGKLALARP